MPSIWSLRNCGQVELFSLECIHIFFLSDSTKKKKLFWSKVKSLLLYLCFSWKGHNKHIHVNSQSFAKALSNYRWTFSNSLRTPTEEGGGFCFYPRKSSTSCRVASFFYGSSEVFFLYFFRQVTVCCVPFWSRPSHLGYLLRGAGFAGHGVIGSSLHVLSSGCSCLTYWKNKQGLDLRLSDS